jgi:hypothetical protein
MGKIGLRKTLFLAAGLLAIGSFVLLFSFRSAAQTGDGLNYLISAQSGKNLFHPHHLLYNPLVRLFYLALSSVCRSCDVFLSAQIHNILWAVAAVIAMFIIIRWLFNSYFIGSAAAVFLLISQGFWKYATQTEVYVPAMACLALVVVMFIRRENSPLSAFEYFLVLLFFILAVFYHQSSVLFLIPLGYLMFATQGRRGKKTFGLLFIMSLLIISSVYILAYPSLGAEKTAAGFLRFCLSYTYHPDPNWGTLRNFSPLGMGRVLSSQIRNLFFVPPAIKIPFIALFGSVLFLLVAWNIRKILKRSDDAKIRAFLLIWLAVHFLFFLWWSPGGQNEFTISLFPVNLLIFITIRDAWRHMNAAQSRAVFFEVSLASIILAAGVFNFWTAIRPLHISKGGDYSAAQQLNFCIPPTRLILTTWDIEHHLIYYFHRENVLEAEIPLLCFYQDMPLDAQYFRVRETELAISPANLLPNCKNVPFNGYERPKGWLGFIAWLFDFEYDAGRRLTSCRSFDVLPCGPGYIQLSTVRMKVNGLGDFFRRLDDLYRRQAFGQLDLFQEWHKKFGDTF